MIKHKCTRCGAILESPSSMIGQEDICPICRQKFTVISNVKEGGISGKLIVAGIVAVGLLVVIAFSLGMAFSSVPQKGEAIETRAGDPLDKPKPAQKVVVPKSVISETPVIASQPQKRPDAKPIPVIVPKGDPEIQRQSDMAKDAAHLRTAKISAMENVIIQAQLDLSTLPPDFGKEVDFIACDLKKLIAKWELIDTSDCPSNFQDAFKELIAATKAMTNTFSSENLVDATDSDHMKNAFDKRAKASALRWKSCLSNLDTIARNAGIKFAE